MEYLTDLINQVTPLLNDNSALSLLLLAILSFALTLIIKIALKITSKILRRIAERTVSIWDDVVLDIIDGLKAWVIFICLFYLSAKYMHSKESIHKFLFVTLVISVVIQITIWGLYLIKNWRKNFIEQKIQQDPSSAAALGVLHTIVQTVFIVIIILIGLSNLGVDITALVAGLGVGGIAIALAAQNVLGDLFASLSIVFDKPFIVGDSIVVGTDKGTIEHIGIKSTRLRSLSGEQLIISNKNLLDSRIQNFKRMAERRIVLNFGIVYNTPADVIEKIPVWVKEFVTKHEKIRFDRCHFCNYGPSSLDYELVFFVLDSDYLVCMDLKQTILLDIFKKFSNEKVAFAFPSQSIYIENMTPPKPTT